MRAGWSYESHSSIVLTSYNIAVNDAAFLRRRQFFLLAIDEAHLLKNSATRSWSVLVELRARHRLLITGTPLSNSGADVFSLL